MIIPSSRAMISLTQFLKERNLIVKRKFTILYYSKEKIRQYLIVKRTADQKIQVLVPIFPICILVTQFDP